MNTQEANDIVERLRSAQRAGAPVEELHGEDARRFFFVDDIARRPTLLGSFVVRAPGLPQFFVSVVVKANQADGFQFFVMDRPRGSPILGSSVRTATTVRWRYTPAKQSGDNAVRKRAFIEANGSDTIDIPLPGDDIVPFASTVVRAITLRRSADAVEENDTDHLDESDDAHAAEVPQYPERRYRILRDCEVWTESHEGSASIIVNSVGGGPDRRPGLARLLRALIEEKVTISEAGYAAKGRYVRLDGVPLSDEATLSNPEAAAQAFHRAVGRVAGANQGSRLRLVLSQVSSSAIADILERIADKNTSVATRGGSGETTSGTRELEDSLSPFELIIERLRQNSLVFSAETVASFLLALQARRFVLLTGISGTGKTQLALEVARIVSPGVDVHADDQDDDDTVEIVVKPYHRKYSRFVVPARLARRLDVLRDSAQKQLDVRIADGRVEALTVGKSADNRNLLEVLLNGESRSTFLRTFALNDRARLKIERRGDRELLAVERVDVSPRAALAPAATHELVAVRPDWTDARALLGFYNPLTRAYVSTPTLELLLRARAEHTRATSTGTSPRPFFLIFDEMNLARVEHYFSDFLSAMESGEAIHLHDDDDLAADDESPIPRRIVVAPNVFVVGTVNVDETTYMFSPKVLDRAFVLEFNHVDLDALGGGPVSTKASSPLALTRLESELRARGPHEDHEWQRFSALLDGALATRLRSIHAALASEHRHFGYRVAREIARFVDLANEQTDGSPEALRAAFDVAVLSKVLPKLNGGQAELESVLQRLFVLACGDGDDADAVSGDAPVDFTAYSASTNGLVRRDGALVEMPRTAQKLWRMQRRLRAHGFAGFIE